MAARPPAAAADGAAAPSPSSSSSAALLLPDIAVSPAERRALSGAVCLVTGAGGYVATHLVARLLAAGATVRACVRSASSASHLRELEARYGGKEGGGGKGGEEEGEGSSGGGRLELFDKCDLLSPGSFDAALSDGRVRYVFHTASPFRMAAPGEELLRAAVGGTREVLSACARLGGASLERVVLTSSVAAVHSHVPAERAGERGKGRPYTQADWNADGSPSYFPYEHSKAAAERWAWRYVRAASAGRAAVPPGALAALPAAAADDDDAAQTAAALGLGAAADGNDSSTGTDKNKAQAISWSLSVVNPAFVLGPPLCSRADGESVGVVSTLLQGGMLGAWPDVHFGACDVRDVAAVHALAAISPTAAGKRLLVAPFPSSFGDVVGAVRRDAELLPRVRLPRRAAFYAVLLALSPLLSFIGLPAYRLRLTYGVPAATYDCSEAEALLKAAGCLSAREEGGGGGGGVWTPRDETVTDMARALLARGMVRDASK